ncbi:hypothetical protein NBY09_08190 [Elizabethkingia anophelis]|uniref:hypothetical protein n=1 Tax=Elizabethkingia anophelis TaxID=1117645 RepID=UPI002350C881|nr:hypothetical protein [Elizabethkingia anophelis]MDC8026141.1 hypothetical protein [Elizabethkingia anophelis]
MGNINNKAQISGAVGNVVFVSNGHKTIVRTKPGKVKQSKSTKAAAGFFGQISRQDSRYRKALLELLQLNTDTTYAYRHRASFGRVAVRYKENETEYMSLLKGSPQAMEGFDFNMQSPWLSLCRFFLKFDLSAQGDLRIKIPDVELGIQIKNDKKNDQSYSPLLVHFSESGSGFGYRYTFAIGYQHRSSSADTCFFSGMDNFGCSEK